ncbi:MAG: hypothetical protein WCC17_03640, partial [Candidatus Nitrosopolaris sp.]
VRHVVPEALVEVKKQILQSIKEIIVQDKIRTLAVPSESEQIMLQFSTYGGLLRSLADLTNEKFGAAGQKVGHRFVLSTPCRSTDADRRRGRGSKGPDSGRQGKTLRPF